MAMRLRVPLLLNAVVVSDPAEMDWFDSDPAVTRKILPDGGWLHRTLHSRIQRMMTVGPVPLPAFNSRDDVDRATQQAKLEFGLTYLSPTRIELVDPGSMRLMARYVAGEELDQPVGVAAQQLIGRMFVADYAATPESYAAAKLLFAWTKPHSVRALWGLWSGQLASSRHLLWNLAGHDPQCIHATALAVHSLVEALDRMRALMGDARRRDVLTPDAAASASLVAPGLLVRSCAGLLRTPFLKRPLGRGTLIVFRLRAMHAGTWNDGLALASGRWNQCPAHATVPRLLGEVWTSARQEWTQLRYARYRPHVLERVAAPAFFALNRLVPWHRLPRPLGLYNLIAYRAVLRQRNLYDVPSGPVTTSGAPGGPSQPPVRSVRTVDGTFNDPTDPKMGSAGTCFGRNLPPAFARPEPEPALFQPNPRLISRRLMTRHEFIPASTLNVLAAAWIQFQAHDWFNHPINTKEKPFELPIGPDDDWPYERPMKVERTQRHGRVGGTPTFANTETHWWDASQLYGSTADLQRKVRSGREGKLRVGEDGRLPFDLGTRQEVAGFTNNWWVGLSLFHLLFALEHNAICDRLHAEYPDWDDERLFATARLINAALLAKIHTLEWTPGILGHPTVKTGMKANWQGLAVAVLGELLGKPARRLLSRAIQSDLVSGIPGSPTEHHSAPYSITEEFVAIYRMHPLMPDEFRFASARDGSALATRDLEAVAGFNTRSVIEAFSIPDLLYSLGIANPGALTLHNYPKALQRLKRPGACPHEDLAPIDLAAVDVLRDRERGIPRYNAFRKMLHLPPVRTFEELNARCAGELRDVYQHVDRIDLMVGLFAEAPPRGFGFSDTAFRLFILMASRRLKSDRFFTVDYTPAVYTQTGLDWIAGTDMKAVLLRHYPELTPAVGRVPNVFAPWDHVG